MKRKSLLMILLMALFGPLAMNAQVSLPYTEGFENMSSDSDLTSAGWIWTASHSGSFLAIETSASNVHTGSKALNIDSWNAGSTSDYVVVGLPTVGATINTLQITFSYKVSMGTVYIGYLTSANDASSFVSLETFSASSNYTTKTVELTDAPATAGRIAIKYLNWYRCYVDDIKVETIPSCYEPQNLTASLTSCNGSIATLNWDRNPKGSENAWVLQVATNDAFTANLQSYPVSNTPSKDLTGLTPETTYYARVKANCGTNDESDWSTTCEFTPTDACSIVVSEGTSTNGYAPLYGNYKSSYDQMIYTASQLEDAGITGPCSITRIGFNSSASNTISRLPVIYICQSDKSSFSSNTDFVSINEFTKVYDYNDNSQWNIAAGWNEFELDTPFDYDGSSNLIIAMHCGIASNYSSTSFYASTASGYQVIYAYHDSTDPNPATYEGTWSSFPNKNYSTSLPSLKLYYEPVAVTCDKPTGLAIVANSLTAHSVAMQWNSEANAVYDYAIVKGTGIDPTTVTYAGSETATGTTCSHTWSSGLDGDSDYTVFIRKNCGNGDYSNPATKVIHTEVACAAPVDFTAVVNGTSVSLSWTGANSDIAWSLNANANPDDYIDPDFNIDQAHGTATMSNMALDTDYYFWVRTNCGGIDGTSTWVGPVSVHIGYCVPAPSSVDYNGITNLTFGTGDYVVNNNSNHPTSAPYYADFSSQIGGVEAGVESQIVITYSTGSYDYQTYVWVDFDNSLTFDNDEIICSGSSNTTLTLTFTVPATTAAGDYRMRIGGADSGMDYGSDPCYTGTYGIFEDYTLRVISVACPAPTITNITPDLNTAVISTDSDAENFNVQYRVVSASATPIIYDFEDGTFSGWTYYDNDGDSKSWIVTDALGSYTSGETYVASHGGAYYLRSTYNSNALVENWLISPQFKLGGSISFYIERLNGYDDYYKVYVSTTGTSISDFTVEVQGEREPAASYELVTIDLSNYSGDGYVAIKHYAKANDQAYLFLDDVTIIEGVENPWQTANDLTLTGLNPETTYQVQVQADCGSEDGVSSWSSISTFTTLSACSTPTGLTAEITGNAAALSWSGYADTYDIQYREADPTAPATIILTAGDVWSDGSGYQMVLDADATMYAQSSISSYDDFEYTIPTDAVFDINATTIVLNNSVSIQIPAGTYDYFIFNPSPDYNAIYVAGSNGNVGGKEDDFVFEAGKTYEFTLFLVSGSEGDGVNLTITDNGNAWTTVNDVTNPYTLPGLSSETTYEWQVQGVDCDGEGATTDWSASAYFTTPLFSEFYKEIAPYTAKGGYYLIASPIGTVPPTSVTNMISNTYDLYAFDQDGDENSNEWINYRPANFNLEAGKGYLYANSGDGQHDVTTLTFIGTAYDGTGTFDLIYSEGNENPSMYGWNLVGNPFSETAYLGSRAFYTMNGTGTEIIAGGLGDAINPMEGVFVVAAATGETVTFSTTDPGKGGSLNLNLSQGRGLVDRAIVRFDEGQNLPKFQIGKNSTKLYIPQDNNDFAVVNSDNQGEMPVNFKAAENGNYTLSINTTNIELGYLHLVDNMTGTDVDLLANPSYTFEAKTTDYANRFKLVYATGNSDDNFAFYSNGSFVINNEGNATLQVIDINGRIINSEAINGCTNLNVNVASGVYMLRLVNGNSVKVQKVVVE